MSARAVKLAVSLALAAATLSLLPSSAQAYVFISTDGCGGGRGAAWPANRLPGTWYLHQDGYSPMQFATVQSTMETSLDTWAAPCCSNWRHSYQGTTASSALGASNFNIVQFEEDSWPNELGDPGSVIAVTLPVPTQNCQIVSADMLFNGVGFTFRVSGVATDLESIATHEFGHWIGLDHTNANGATMLPFYSGGTAERTLTQDDQNGACALYPRACAGCTTDLDCPQGQECVGGTCEVPSCQSTQDCDLGTICSGGACVPGCRADNECQAGYTCQSGACRRPPGACTICSDCTQNADCGGASYYCVDLGGPSGQCTKVCRSDNDCDGDSRCWTVSDGSGNQYQLCFAPDAQQELCPSSYTCQDEPVNQPGCAGLWDFCTADRSSCTADSDICIQTGATAKCSCTCTVDADCGANAVCARDPASGQLACFPDNVLDPCQNVVCRVGQECQDGVCVSTDPCEGVNCAVGETCQNGNCVSPCGTCPEGRVCDPVRVRCVFPDACTGVTCPAGRICDPADGTCRFPDPCDGVTCAAGQHCEDGRCVEDATDPCDACTAGQTCVDDTCVDDVVDPCATLECRPGNVCDDGLCVPDPNAPPSGGGGGSAQADSGCSAAGGSASALGLLAAAGLLGRRRRRGSRPE